MATWRGGKPYIWVTWLTKLLGGDTQCVWAAWFKAHHRYDKFEKDGGNLAKWSQDHDALVQAKRDRLVHDGWTVSLERENEFRLEGQAAIVAGKPDLVARKANIVVVGDGKTGQPRQSDRWQMFWYLYALPKCRKEWFESVAPLNDGFSGVLHYSRSGDVTIYGYELTDEVRQRMIRLVHQVSQKAPPAHTPSPGECARCDIGPADCAMRILESQAPVGTDDF